MNHDSIELAADEERQYRSNYKKGDPVSIADAVDLLQVQARSRRGQEALGRIRSQSRRRREQQYRVIGVPKQ